MADSDLSLALQRIKELEGELAKLKTLRESERNGRISLQKKGAEATRARQKTDGYTFPAIGIVHTPFPDRRGSPRQPLLCPAASGRIKFDKSIVQYEHYKELEQFSHIWVIFVFNFNTNMDSCDSKHTASAKIKPPRLGGSKVGCLSTRSPHRPNPIGLSVCELVAVDKDFIHVRGVDFVDGTTVLDVKPYIPYDIVPSSLQLPMARDAEGEPLNRRELCVPSWIHESDIPLRPVRFAEGCCAQLQQMYAAGQGSRHCANAEHATELITQVLRQDIRGAHQGRGCVDRPAAEGGAELEGTSAYMCNLDGLVVLFKTLGEEILVVSVTESDGGCSVV